MNTLTPEELKRIEHEADAYVSNHPDSEVRRMFGHYYRAYAAGATKEALRAIEKKKALLDEVKELRRFFRKKSPLTKMMDALIEKHEYINPTIGFGYSTNEGWDLSDMS